MLVGKSWLFKSALNSSRLPGRSGHLARRSLKDIVHSVGLRHEQRRILHVTLSYSSSAFQHERSSRIISSLTNPYVKHCGKLRTNTKYRQEERSALLAGIVPILELKRECQDLDIRTLLWSGSPNALPAELQDATLLLVTDDILKKVSGLQTVKGLYAIAEIGLPIDTDFAAMPEKQLKRLLVLDGVQDPGNLGTLMRTAIALGWQGVFFLEGCCDPFNDKAVRASRGATFQMPLAFGSWKELHAILKKHDLTCYAADSQGASGVKDNKKSMPQRDDSRNKELQEEGLALVLGAEGQGLSDASRRSSLPVRIPMSGAMESLCVSQAGAILLFLLGSCSPYSLPELESMIEPQARDSLEW